MQKVDILDWMVCRDILSFQQIGPDKAREEAIKFMQKENLTIDDFNRIVIEYNREFRKEMDDFFTRTSNLYKRLEKEG